MKRIFLAGGDGYDAKEIFKDLRGVEEVVPGEGIAFEGTAAFGAAVGFNPKIIDVGSVLTAFFEAVSPYAVKADDNMLQVFYADGEDLPQIEYYVNFLQCRGSEPAAALGSLIVNDSMTPEREHGRTRVEYRKLKEFKPQS